jgi:uncharacterized membrane protein YfcA
VIGGVLGAYVLANTLPEVARPLVLAYLALIGLFLLWRGLRHRPQERRPRVVEPLGLVGGFLDAAGGGGWGSVVTGNLLIQGANPRKTIGTVNTAEFFVAITVSLTFILTLGWEQFTTATMGLLLGGIFAAPLGAVLARRISADLLMIMVGIVLTLTSAYASGARWLEASRLSPFGTRPLMRERFWRQNVNHSHQPRRRRCASPWQS